MQSIPKSTIAICPSIIIIESKYITKCTHKPMNHQTSVHIAQWHKPLVIIALHNMQCAHYKLQNPKSWIIATCKEKITITPQRVGIWESKLYFKFWCPIKLWQWLIDNCWPTKTSTCKLHDTMMLHSPSMHNGTLHIAIAIPKSSQAWCNALNDWLSGLIQVVALVD